MTDPYEDPNWFPWDVESARRWAWTPPRVDKPPFDGLWCPACGRLEQRDRNTHGEDRPMVPVAPDRRCRPSTVYAVTLVLLDLGDFHPSQVAHFPRGYWCPDCRYLVPPAPETHPALEARPFRTLDCQEPRCRPVLVKPRAPTTPH